MVQGRNFTSRIVWTGNRGTGTSGYRDYDRTWNVEVPGREVIHCSNDPLLGGDPDLPNPEDMLLSALAACHMLWFLHRASEAGLVVMQYRDCPAGLAETAADGAGRFVAAELRPEITLQEGDPARADEIHAGIHAVCFIARSVNFPVTIRARYLPAE